MLMSSVRLYVSVPLAVGTKVALPSAQAHYLRTVMRRLTGDTVCLFNGRDGEWEAGIVALDRHAARVEVQTCLRAQAPEPDLWLVFALLKRDATDVVVEKATELGVSALWPVVTARCVVRGVHPDRLQRIAIEAAEQCERLSVPEIHEPRPLSDLLATWPEGRRLIVAAERVADLEMAAVPPPSALLVGPEGGFDPAELDALRARPLVTFASLGPRILRAETAAIAGLARLQGPGRG
jgi:16S rRNA (uracil1498-N3)-methyltransferase